MNKYQEALNELASYYDYDDYPKILQELVDKATPKKPIKRICKRIGGGKIIEDCCPVCKSRLYYSAACCNNNCRQAIDWSEDNE
jgi:hypothetical protein